MIAAHAIADAFSPDECDRIASLAEAIPARDAGLVRGGHDHNQRRAEIVWLDDTPDCAWVMDRLIALVRDANRATFGFDITEFAESPQVALYRGSREGHFDWHADIGDGPVARKRKLTLVAQLSDPAGYSGGTLEIMLGARTVTADLAHGAAVLFPSFLLHRVRPVTEGVRRSLTVWCHGPAFR